MGEVARIADQLRRAFEGNAWHGPAIRELLIDVTARQASAKPIAGAHSIWEIVLHIAAWKKAVSQRVKGLAVELSPAEDWPTVTETSETAWRKTLENLHAAHDELLRTVSVLTDSKLEETVPGKDYSVYVLLHGLVQHDLYHAGQIALLKKIGLEK